MINWILYEIGKFIALYFPKWITYFLVWAICGLKYRYSRADRRAVIYNLRRVLPQTHPKEINRIAKKVFINFGEYLVSFFRFSTIDKRFIERNVEIKNLEYLDQALKKGRGVILVSAHLGNWELGGAIVAKLGYPFYGVALSHAHPKVNKFFNDQRLLCGVRIVPVGATLRQCFKLLKKNATVAFLGDRDFSNAGRTFTFCGKRALIPRGAAKFCLKTGALILPTFAVRQDRERFSLIFEKPIEAKDGKGRLKDERRLIKEYLKVIERYIKTYPEQWYMFQPFFLDEYYETLGGHTSLQ